MLVKANLAGNVLEVGLVVLQRHTHHRGMANKLGEPQLARDW
jgi:hypothetical protein